MQQRREPCLPIWYNHGVGSPIDSRVTGSLAELAARRGGLRLFVVFGSQARGDDHERSDWDLGYLGEPGLDADRLLADGATITADAVRALGRPAPVTVPQLERPAVDLAEYDALLEVAS